MTEAPSAGAADFLPLVSRLASRVARRLAADPEDLAQEAFVRIVSEWHRHDARLGRSRKTWVLATARGAMLDAARRNAVGRAVVRVPRSAYAKGVRAPAESLDAPRPGRGEGEASGTPADTRDLLRLAESLLRRGLTTRESRIVELRFAQGLPFAQVASAIGVSETAVFDALRRLVADGRAAVAAWGWGDA